jgi:hypothetical protein
MKHVRELPPPLPPDIPPAVRTIVDRALAKEPAARFPTAAVLGQVARQAAAGLAGGGVGPQIPMQTSPGPVGARPPVPGGTRMLPGGGYPGTATQRPTGYGRAAGAATPPQPPRRGETTYFSPSSGSFPAAAPGGGTKTTGPHRKAVLTGVLVGLVALLLIGAGVTAYVLTSNNTDPGSAAGVATSSAPAPSAAPPTTDGPTAPNGGGDNGDGTATAQTVEVGCGSLEGASYSQVKAVLKEKGLRATENEVSGGEKNKVKSLSPCQAHQGDVITVTVYTGPRHDDQPTPTPRTPTPTPTCTMGGLLNDCGSTPIPSQTTKP